MNLIFESLVLDIVKLLQRGVMHSPEFQISWNIEMSTKCMHVSSSIEGMQY